MEFLRKNKIAAIVLVILIPLIGTGVYLALNPTVFRPKATGVSMKFNQTSIVKNKGELVILPITINPSGKKIVGIDATVKFDPAKLEVESISDSPFGQVVKKDIDAAGGKIRIVGVNFKDNVFTPPFAQPNTFVTVNFKAKAGGKSNVEFITSLVTAEGSGENLLSETNKSEIAINDAATGNNFRQWVQGKIYDEFSILCNDAGMNRDNCQFDVYAHYRGYDTLDETSPWFNAEVIVGKGKWWVLSKIYNPNSHPAGLPQGARELNKTASNVRYILASGAVDSAEAASAVPEFKELCDYAKRIFNGSYPEGYCKIDSYAHFRAYDFPNEINSLAYNTSLTTAYGQYIWTADINSSKAYQGTNKKYPNGRIVIAQGPLQGAGAPPEFAYFCDKYKPAADRFCQINSYSHYRNFDVVGQSGNDAVLAGYGKILVFATATYTDAGKRIGNHNMIAEGNLNDPNVVGQDFVDKVCVGKNPCNANEMYHYLGFDTESKNNDFYNIDFIASGPDYWVRTGSTPKSSSPDAHAGYSVPENIRNGGIPVASIFVKGELATRTLVGTTGQVFDTGKIFATATAGEGKNLTDTGIVVIKVDNNNNPIPLPTIKSNQNENWTCGNADPNDPNKNKQVDVESGDFAAVHFSRYCFIAPTLRNVPTGQVNSRPFSIDKPGKYLIIIDAVQDTGRCSGKPWGLIASLGDKQRCQIGSDFLTLNITQVGLPTAEITKTPANLGRVGQAFPAGTWEARVNAPAGIQRVGMVIYRADDGWECPSGYGTQVASGTKFCFIENTTTPGGTSATISSKAWTPSKPGAYTMTVDVIDSENVKCSNYSQLGVTICGRGAEAVINVDTQDPNSMPAPTAFIHFTKNSGSERYSDRELIIPIGPVINNQSVGIRAEFQFPTGATSNTGILAVKRDPADPKPLSGFNIDCSSPNTKAVSNGVEYCFVNLGNVGENQKSGALGANNWSTSKSGQYVIFVESIDKNGRKCSGWENAFHSPHPEANVAKCSNDGSDFLTLVTSGTDIPSEVNNQQVQQLITLYGKTIAQLSQNQKDLDQNNDGKLNSLDFAILFYKGR